MMATQSIDFSSRRGGSGVGAAVAKAASGCNGRTATHSWAEWQSSISKFYSKNREIGASQLHLLQYDKFRIGSYEVS